MAQTVYLRPTADVSLSHSRSTGNNGYNLLSEVTQDGDSTYIYSEISGNNTNTSTQTSSFTLSANIGAGKRILSAKIVAYAKISASNSGTKSLSLTCGSNNKTSTLTTSYAAYELNIDLANITLNNENASTTVDIQTTGKKNDKNDSTFQLRITQLYIELSVEDIVKFYAKINGAWRSVKAYQKVNGTWNALGISQISSWSSGDNIIQSHWDINKVVPQGDGLTSVNGWVTTEYVQISSSSDVTVQGAQYSNNMFNVYNSDKSYNDYWTNGSSTTVATVDGVSIKRRTLTPSQINGGTFVRVSIPANAIQYCKIEQNGTVLFDGSQYALV